MLARSGRRFQKTHPGQTRFGRAVLLVIFGITLIYLAIGNWRIAVQRINLVKSTANLMQEVKKLEARNSDLQNQISQVKTDDYLEKTARNRLNLKKPGEEVVAIIPGEQKPVEAPKPEKSLWQKFLENLPKLPF